MPTSRCKRCQRGKPPHVAAVACRNQCCLRGHCTNEGTLPTSRCKCSFVYSAVPPWRPPLVASWHLRCKVQGRTGRHAALSTTSRLPFSSPLLSTRRLTQPQYLEDWLVENRLSANCLEDLLRSLCIPLLQSTMSLHFAALPRGLPCGCLASSLLQNRFQWTRHSAKPNP